MSKIRIPYPLPAIANIAEQAREILKQKYKRLTERKQQ